MTYHDSVFHCVPTAQFEEVLSGLIKLGYRYITDGLDNISAGDAQLLADPKTVLAVVPRFRAFTIIHNEPGAPERPLGRHITRLWL